MSYCIKLIALLVSIAPLSLIAQVVIDPIVIEKANRTGQIDVLVIMRDQADLSATAQLSIKLAKGRYVYETLKAEAEASQTGLITYLSSQPDLVFRSFFLVNSCQVAGPAYHLQKLSELPGVAAIIENAAYSLQKPVESQNIDNRGPLEIPWGIIQIGADQLWAMNIKGAGVVIGGADTGIDWTHPALTNSYRGNVGGTSNHDFDWHDCIHDVNYPDSITNPCGYDTQQPCDDSEHGTHTIGTCTGLGTDEQIGVAPEAKWIGVRNMRQGNGTLATYIEGFEWFIAPTNLAGENADPDKAPHVINNSWYCSEAEGCNPSNFATLKAVVEAVRAAGIVPVISVGNSGSSCSSANNPPGFFAAAFSVGASKIGDLMAGYSSRGPVTIDSSGRIRPDVVAPGSGIRSCIPGGGYGNKSGTSMSGPHVAGAVALLISANPNLAGQVDQIEEILKMSAVAIADSVACGGIAVGITPNHAAGYGRINLVAAVNMALTATTDPAAQSMILFPNPNRGSFQVILPEILPVGRCLVYDFMGRVVLNTPWSAGHTTKTIDLPHAPTAGQYQIVISGGDQVFSTRFVVVD
jgi:serine protease AprX